MVHFRSYWQIPYFCKSVNYSFLLPCRITLEYLMFFLKKHIYLWENLEHADNCSVTETPKNIWFCFLNVPLMYIVGLSSFCLFFTFTALFFILFAATEPHGYYYALFQELPKWQFLCFGEIFSTNNRCTSQILMFDSAVSKASVRLWSLIVVNIFFKIFRFKFLSLRQYQLSQRVKIITGFMGK